MKKLKAIPKFKNEDAERDFWAKHDAVDYFDVSNPIKMDLSQLKPSTKSVTLRMSESMVDSLKKMANKRDVPYQSFVKTILAEKIDEEYRVSTA